MSSSPMHRGRDYAHLLPKFQSGGLLPVQAREERMRQVVDALWEATGTRGVSWIGFYLKSRDRDEMILGPRRDKPACSPIGLNGVCGRCWRERRAILVADVATLGANYIACDPRDRSEAVIPLFENDGSCWGVLDADSYDIGSFESADIIGLTAIVEHAGLSKGWASAPPAIRI